MFSLSAVDGRYALKTAPIAKLFSEANLIKSRIIIEVRYLLALAEHKLIRKISVSEKKLLLKLCEPTLLQLKQLKKIENKTHHDVKAIEYFLRENIKTTSLKDLSPYLHFGLTSEDINNLAYRLMVQAGMQQVLLPQLQLNLTQLTQISEKYCQQPMLARTHGQRAIPTTFGKELAVFINRLLPLIKQLHQFKLLGKLNGAVGGYQALQLSFPATNLIAFSKNFVEAFDFEFLPISTQLNPNDDLVCLSQKLYHLNLILIGLNQDLWRYISDDWLLQKHEQGSVGSSTMPQKINPIEFENSEGNLKMANGLLQIFIDNLPISRLQRDLSDSTVMRNFGQALAHCLLAYQSLEKGLAKISINQLQLEQDLLANWNILSEAAQTLARKKGDDQAYEKIALACKKKSLHKQDWLALVQNIDSQLLTITPKNYLGLSVKLTKQTIKKSYQLIKEMQS